MVNFKSNRKIICDPAQAAFITIDFQNFFCHFSALDRLSEGRDVGDIFSYVSKSERQQRYIQAAKQTNHLLPIFRKAGAKIVHVRMRMDGVPEIMDDFFGIEIDAEYDHFARKASPSAFLNRESHIPIMQSDLQRCLKKSGVSKLFFAGVHTNACLSSTVNNALGHGYDAVVIPECTEAMDTFSKHQTLFELKEKGAEIIGAQETYDFLTASV